MWMFKKNNPPSSKSRCKRKSAPPPRHLDQNMGDDGENERVQSLMKQDTRKITAAEDDNT